MSSADYHPLRFPPPHSTKHGSLPLTINHAAALRRRRRWLPTAAGPGCAAAFIFIGHTLASPPSCSPRSLRSPASVRRAVTAPPSVERSPKPTAGSARVSGRATRRLSSSRSTARSPTTPPGPAQACPARPRRTRCASSPHRCTTTAASSGGRRAPSRASSGFLPVGQLHQWCDPVKNRPRSGAWDPEQGG